MNYIVSTLLFITPFYISNYITRLSILKYILYRLIIESILREYIHIIYLYTLQILEYEKIVYYKLLGGRGPASPVFARNVHLMM